MSWHPNSKRAIFSEVSTDDKKRVRIVRFDNYKPSESIKPSITPDDIPYAKKLEDLQDYKSDINNVIKGMKGYIIVNKTEAGSKSEYVNYSQDGKIFYDGYEQFSFVGSQNVGRIISKVTMTGEKEGKMDLMLTMNINGQVIYEQDGNKVTYGYVYYNGKNLTVEESYN